MDTDGCSMDDSIKRKREMETEEVFKRNKKVGTSPQKYEGNIKKSVQHKERNKRYAIGTERK